MNEKSVSNGGFFLCALVAERSRSAEHFTEKSRISAALNDRDFFCTPRLYKLLISDGNIITKNTAPESQTSEGGWHVKVL